MVPIVHFSNIAIAILDFSLLQLNVITLNPLCTFFGISSLLFFDGFLFKAIALPTIAIVFDVSNTFFADYMFKGSVIKKLLLQIKLLLLLTADSGILDNYF